MPSCVLIGDQSHHVSIWRSILLTSQEYRNATIGWSRLSYSAKRTLADV